MDIRAFLDQTIVLKPFQRILVPTGLFIELPQGFEAQIRPRSGLAIKFGISILNSPGTIDADYRGEIKSDPYQSVTRRFPNKRWRQNCSDGYCQTRIN